MQNKALTALAGVGLIVICCWLLQVLKFVFLPLVIAIFIAILLSPMVGWLTRRKAPRVIAVFLTLVLAVSVLYLLGSIVYGSLSSFQDEFPKYEPKIDELIEQGKGLANLEIGPLDSDRLQAELGKLSLGSIAGTTIGSFFRFLVYLLFTVVFVLYFLMGGPSLTLKIRKAFQEDEAGRVIRVMDNISLQVQKYIWAKTLTSVVTGMSMVIICLSFGVDFPITWGFFAFVLNFVPTVGVFFAALPSVLMVLIQYGSWVRVIWFIIVVMAVMQVLGQIIEPKILGDSVNLSALVALLSLIFWGWLWGPAGMVVAVPLTALIKFTCDHVEGLKPIGVLMGSES